MEALGLILGCCHLSALTPAEMYIIFSSFSNWSMCVTTVFCCLNHMASVPHFVYETPLALLLDPNDEGEISPCRQAPEAFYLLFLLLCCSCQVPLCFMCKWRTQILTPLRFQGFSASQSLASKGAFLGNQQHTAFLFSLSLLFFLPLPHIPTVKGSLRLACRWCDVTSFILSNLLFKAYILCF